MARFKHVIWDWNGTLLNDVQACADAINILLARRRLPAVSLQQYLDIFDFPVRDYYLRLGFDFTRDNWDSVAIEYHEAYAKTSLGAPLRIGTEVALNTLGNAGVGVSVLSACELGLLKRMMEERGIIQYFEHIYGLTNLYAASKLDLGHTLLNNTGLSRSDTIMIGDTTHDYEVAQAMGIPCLLMSGGHQAAWKLTSLGCPLVADLNDVLSHVIGPS